MREARAGFGNPKTIEDFDFNARLPKSKILELCTYHFLTTHTNVVIVGPSGVGKSHLAHAIGHRPSGVYAWQIDLIRQRKQFVYHSSCGAGRRDR